MSKAKTTIKSTAKTGARLAKARSASSLGCSKRKVDFVPSRNSEARIAMASDANHVRNVNNITRFHSVR